MFLAQIIKLVHPSWLPEPQPQLHQVRQLQKRNQFTDQIGNQPHAQAPLLQFPEELLLEIQMDASLATL